MNLLIAIILGAVVAYITKLLLEFIGIPQPFPNIIALVVFLVMAFGGELGIRNPWR